MLRAQPKTRDIIWLDSDLLSELSMIAKTKAEAIINVKTWWDMPEGYFAYVFLKGRGDFEGRPVSQNTIGLLDGIDLAELRAVYRPEMDWDKISHDKIYHFIIHHEIGHALTITTGFNTKTRVNRDGTINKTETEMVSLANEMIADRYAWKQLFPSQPFPKREGCESAVREIESFMVSHRNAFSKYFAFVSKNPGSVLI